MPGTPNVNQTKKPVRLVGYRVDGKKYWVATDRHDIIAEEVACIYKLRWDIEIFFGWWKRHLKVYHLIARSQYGLMVQILGGLITYLLIAMYCKNNFNEKVSIKRVRELRIKIKNEATSFDFLTGRNKSNPKKQKKDWKLGKQQCSKRGQMIESVFGQIKDARGICRFLRRGLNACASEWKLICTTHNLLKLYRSGKASWA